MKCESRDCFFTRLPGGLGNQLFALFASRYISQMTGMTNHLDFGGVDYSHSEEPYDIRSFILDSNETNSFKHGLADWILENCINTFSNLSLDKRLQRLSWSGIIQFPLTFDDRNSVTDYFSRSKRDIRFSFKTRIVDSYFADFSFFDCLNKGEHKSIQLRSISKYYSSKLDEFKSKSTMAIHLRLGDFLKNGKSIGILGDTYFKKSISNLMQLGDFEKVVLFSDSPNIARSRVSSWKLRFPIEYIELQDLKNPAEVMKLMSMCDGLVCSNSTFSFWAAKFATQESGGRAIITIPKNFRRDKLASVGSIPSNWRVEEPFWV
jgi:hypothetical protein